MTDSAMRMHLKSIFFTIAGLMSGSSRIGKQRTKYKLMMQMTCSATKCRNPDLTKALTLRSDRCQNMKMGSNMFYAVPVHTSSLGMKL